MNRTITLVLASVATIAMAQLRPQAIIVNPNPPTDLQVRVWVDKDPGKTGNPVYQFGEP
ncbi:MAG: PEGA domain-containing protein, partial [Meiothermus sp.]|nr:PEGA domain-containing protein [Meiothermus sp.]